MSQGVGAYFVEIGSDTYYYTLATKPPPGGKGPIEGLVGVYPSTREQVEGYSPTPNEGLVEGYPPRTKGPIEGYPPLRHVNYDGVRRAIDIPIVFLFVIVLVH